MRKWEVVMYGMDENYSTDRTVVPRVLSRHWSRRAAERAAYRRNHGRAIHSTTEQWRATQVNVRREGDWMFWDYVKSYGDRVGATG